MYTGSLCGVLSQPQLGRLDHTPSPSFATTEEGVEVKKPEVRKGWQNDDGFWAQQDCAHELTATMMACIILDKTKLVSILVWSGEGVMSTRP